MVISSIKQTCSACPSQWEGLLEDGRPIYVRYRWGALTIHVGATGGSIQDALGCDPYFDQQVGDSLDGSIELTEVCRLTGLTVPTSGT